VCFVRKQTSQALSTTRRLRELFPRNYMVRKVDESRMPCDDYKASSSVVLRICRSVDHVVSASGVVRVRNSSSTVASGELTLRACRCSKSR
jgi:hypothetical protein